MNANVLKSSRDNYLFVVEPSRVEHIKKTQILQMAAIPSTSEGKQKN